MDRYLKMKLCCTNQKSVEVRKATLKCNSESGRENIGHATRKKLAKMSLGSLGRQKRLKRAQTKPHS